MKPSIKLSIFLGIISGLIIFLFNYLFESLHLKNILLSLIVFITVSVLSFLFTKKYINERIRFLYKQIFNIEKQNSNNEKKELNNLEEIDKEVIKWADEKADEIKKLKTLENYRKEFIGNVSHELKTPIFTIQGYVYTLLEGGLEDPSINRKYLEKTAVAIERMINIVKDLEEISKLESGVLKLQIENFNITEVTQDVFDHLEMKAKKRKIKLCFDKNSEKPIYVRADKERIRQVMTNLIENSISYGVENGTTIVRFLPIENKVLVEVIDNGIGIEAKDLPRIFERFYRCDKARSREQGGTGLGLAIVKHILEAHKQKINVTSTPSVGSTFSFTLDKA